MLLYLSNKSIVLKPKLLTRISFLF